MKSRSKLVDIPAMLLALGMEFRKRGSEYWSPCPNHRERTASWSIGDHGGHHCFGCKWGGGALDLVLKVVGLSDFRAANSWIEEKGFYLDGPMPLNVKLQVTRPDAVTEMQMPPDARILPMADWVTPARRYARKRGLTADQVTRWGLGYAAGGYYANRILLPTRDRTGRLLNITGRAWSSTKTPKYLNAKELHGWDPGAIFGEQHWPKYLTRATLVLCEGELNALAVERRALDVRGGLYVGALGGSQLEKEQVLKLGQFQRVIIAVDMDRAGSDVARALRATLARWRRCLVLAFPDARDPNDLEREAPQVLDKLILEAA